MQDSKSQGKYCRYKDESVGLAHFNTSCIEQLFSLCNDFGIQNAYDHCLLNHFILMYFIM